MTRITFCGAARTVTGSCMLVETAGRRFLVDCGLFQGPKTIKELNYRPFPFDASAIDFGLLTHAHIDHAGLVPKLVRAGFAGPVIATRGTRDLLTFMLPDSGHIQEMEVAQLNKRLARRGRPTVEPIYTQADATAALQAIRTVEYEQWTEPAPGIRVRYWNAGHILGSASVEVEIASEHGRRPTRILFSGDLGPDNKLFHPDPEAPRDLDYVVCEATYGGRSREHLDPSARRALLGREARAALVDRNGVLVIPVFAVERTQELLTDLLALRRDGAIPPVPVFLDSPLAIRVTRVFAEHASDLEDLSGLPDLMDNTALRPTESVEESKAIARVMGGAVILSASGMCEAGRIRHHLKRLLPRRDATVLFVGYQAGGTLGRILVDGAKRVTIQGDRIGVNASIRTIDAYSGHADGTELADWIIERGPMRALFLTHGEEEAMEALAREVTERGLRAERIIVPDMDEAFAIEPGRAPAPVERERRLPPKTILTRDWHNDLAELAMELRERFENAADEKARAKFLRRIRRAMEE